MRAVVAISLFACSACAGSRGPLVAKPPTPHANDHGLARIGPCLPGTEADRRKLDLPPTLIGRIVGVDAEAIAVEPEQPSSGGTSPIDVPISDGTVLCTVAGGFAQRADLTVGLHVAVWLPAGRHAALGAVAVMLAAKEPGVDWPDATP